MDKQYTLIRDILSGKRETYAKRGEKVTIISISEPAIIVQSVTTGNKFTITKNDIIGYECTITV